MSWLLHSMTPEVSNGYLLLRTAKEIWDAAVQTYSKIGNIAQIFYLKRRIYETTQKDMSLSTYFHTFRGLWQELDYYHNFQVEILVDTLKFNQLVEQEWIFYFLFGLRDEYDQIRVQILGKEPLPSLRGVYAYVQSEESRRGVMLHSVAQKRFALVTAS